MQTVKKQVSGDCQNLLKISFSEIFKATHESNLRQHVKSSHEEGTYSCKHCDYKVNHKDRVQQHVEYLVVYKAVVFVTIRQLERATYNNM